MFIGVSVAGHESVLVTNCLSHLNLNPLSISNWKLGTSFTKDDTAQKHPKGEEDSIKVKQKCSITGWIVCQVKGLNV